MKITAEFNSVAELISFANTFVGQSFVPQHGVGLDHASTAVKTVSVAVETNTDKTEISKAAAEADVMVTTNQDEPAEQQQSSKPEETEAEEPKVTKEMVRERLGSIMKAGKQKEVKALVAKYGASKVPDLKEEDYAAVYKEAEGLL